MSKNLKDVKVEEPKVTPQEFQKVVANCELANVNLQKCFSECHIFPTLVEPANTLLNIANDTSWKINKEKTTLVCFVLSKVSGTLNKAQGTNQPGEALFDIEVKIALVYRLTSQDLSEEAISLFASRNAVFNGYPFLRETISNLTTRMGIPPVLLPLYKPTLNTSSSKEESKKLEISSTQ